MCNHASHQHHEGEEGFSLDNRSGKVQHCRQGWCLHDSGYAEPWGFSIETLQCKKKETRRLSSSTSPSVTGKPVLKEWFLACMPWSYTQRPLTSKPYSHWPWGTQRKWGTLAKQFLTPAFVPSTGARPCIHTHDHHRRTLAVAGCVCKIDHMNIRWAINISTILTGKQKIPSSPISLRIFLSDIQNLAHTPRPPDAPPC